MTYIEALKDAEKMGYRSVWYPGLGRSTWRSIADEMLLPRHMDLDNEVEFEDLQFVLGIRIIGAEQHIVELSMLSSAFLTHLRDDESFDGDANEILCWMPALGITEDQISQQAGVEVPEGIFDDPDSYGERLNPLVAAAMETLMLQRLQNAVTILDLHPSLMEFFEHNLPGRHDA